VRFCPRCAAEARVSFPRELRCEHCGYHALWSPEPVAAAIPRDADGRIWLLRRALDPGRGLWTFPGGFVDLGESVEDGARRETREEMGIEIELGALVGVYSRADDRIALIVYEGTPLGVPEALDEALEVRAFAVADVPWDELAFWSTERALRDSIAAAA